MRSNMAPLLSLVFVSMMISGMTGNSGATLVKELQAHISVGDYLKDHKAPPTPLNVCPYHPKPVPLPSPLPKNVSDALKNMSESAKSVINATNLPGLVGTISYLGKTLLTVEDGVIKKGSTTAPDVDTIFRIGSVTKVFTVLAMFQLLDRKHIKSLDDPLSDYCPLFSIKNPYDIENVVTLRQMASELSGLPNEPPCTPNIIKKNLCPDTNNDILAKLKDQYIAMPAWTRPSYSNLAYGLLGRCLIHHYNPAVTFEEYVENNILKPLNMTSTGFEYTDDVIARMATGYDVNGNPVPGLDLGWAAPAGQMYSTVSDLMKFAEFFNSYGKGGKILSPHLVKEMLLPAFIDYDFVTVFGSPWEMILEGSYLIVSKGGSVNGYGAFFTFIPELQLSYVVMYNGNYIPESIVATPYALLLTALVPALANMQPKQPLPPHPEVYIGNYSDQFGIFKYSINQYEDTLVVTSSTNFVSYLSYKQDLLLQIVLPPSLPCVFYEITAANNQWLYFDEVDETGKSPGFTFPGLYGTDKFLRIKS